MKLINAIQLTALVLLTTACGKIPQAYQGSFEDKNQGVKLVLDGSSGIMTFNGGRQLQAKVEDSNVDSLINGKSGMYMSTNSEDSSKSDIVWLNLNTGSKQAQEGLVWYQAEVIYTLLNINQKDKVPNIELAHCLDGEVLIDTDTKKYVYGCPAGAESYNAVRTN